VSRARTALAASVGAAVVLAASACAPQPTTTASAANTATGAAACTASHLSLYKQGQLTVATDSPAYAPWFDNNSPADGKGFESAVAYAVAAKLGFSKNQVKWVVEPFDNSYAPGAKNFDFDINEISITPQRAQAVDFSSSYYDANQGVLVLNKSKFANATSLAQLKDARIGVQVATTSYQAVLDQIKPTKQPSVYNTTNDVTRKRRQLAQTGTKLHLGSTPAGLILTSRITFPSRSCFPCTDITSHSLRSWRTTAA